MPKKGMHLTTPNPQRTKPLSKAPGAIIALQRLESAAKKSLLQRGIKNPTKMQLMAEKAKLSRR